MKFLYQRLDSFKRYDSKRITVRDKKHSVGKILNIEANTVELHPRYWIYE